MAEKDSGPTETSDTGNVLSSGVELRGTLKFARALAFDGKLEGDIVSEGSLNLGDNAVVNGNINVGNAVLRGTINGNVTAREKIDIRAGTRMFGDIRATRLVLEEGATLVGQTQVGPQAPVPPPVPTSPSGQSAKPAEPGKPGRF